MKREVSFFKDRRATSGKALLAAMRAVGMSDAEIIEALKASQHGVQADVAHSQQSGVNAEDSHSVESPRG